MSPRILVFLLLAACERRDQLTLDGCTTVVFNVTSWNLLEPGNQTLHLDVSDRLNCTDAGPNSVSVTAVTESGVNVLKSFQVQPASRKETGELVRPSLDLEVEVPSNATQVTFEIGAERRVVTVLPTPTAEVGFEEHRDFDCDLAMPWRNGTICLFFHQLFFITPASERLIVGAGRGFDAMAVTPSGVWSVEKGYATFLPADGGAKRTWEQPSSTPVAIATEGDRVFVSSDSGVNELIVGQVTPISGLNPQSSFPPRAMRVEPPELVLATQERIDRVPLSSFLTAVPTLPSAQNPTVLNFNSTTGLWRIVENRIELTTPSGVLSVEVPALVMARVDFHPKFQDPAIPDETPLLRLGWLVGFRDVWLHPVEDLDAGTIEVRYLTAPAPYKLTRANSHFIYASTPGISGGGAHWGPRR